MRGNPAGFPLISSSTIAAVDDPSELTRFITEVLHPALYRDRIPLEVTAREIRGEPVGFSEATAGQFVPFPMGSPWGPAWSTTWFRLRGRVPEAWADREVTILLDLGFGSDTGFTCEALLWQDGQPVHGLSPNHRTHLVAAAAKGGEVVHVYIEAAANPDGVGYLRGPEPAPSALAQSDDPNPLYVFKQAELAVSRPDVRALELECKLLFEIAEAVPGRRSEIAAALSECARLLDPDRLDETISRAHAALGPVSQRPASSAAHQISATGHAHIDTAWLWPLREARRKCARSFSTATSLMDVYPDYRFACSQAAQYAWMKEHYPDIYRRIKDKVAAGQWEPVGSMWVEADCNLASGESLARQLLHGKRFFMEEFGYETEDVWLPDVFGYAASFPQLMKEAGAKYFLTQKISWSQYNKFPHHTFWWEGIDGTRVFTHFPPADTYNGSMQPSQLVGSVENFREKGKANRSLYLYGWGDGGGGPEPEMIERARRLADFEGMPRVELDRAIDFFHKAEAEAKNLAVWSGELYLELHRGTYTTQARTKQLNRRAELALRNAELLASISGIPYPAAELEAAWKTLLLNQFHDILPGSSIDWVYEENHRDLEGVIATANAICESCMRVLASWSAGSAITVFNPNSHERTELIDIGGTLFPVSLPACGYAELDPAEPRAMPAAVSAGERHIENEHLRVEWDASGCLVSIHDKTANREVLAAGARGNLFQLHVDDPKLWDAWDIDIEYRDSVTDITDLESVDVVDKGPLRASVRFARRFGASRISQVMKLDAGSRVLKFETEVDWHEDHKLLKVAFPVEVRSSTATYEIQFGHVERPTHQNTSWDLAKFEVCAHKWADLSEPGYGVALLNDCKYGHDILGNVMRLTLLRAPTRPDPTADRGHHEFTYALMPHQGDFRQAGVIQAAYDLNVPPIVLAGGASPKSHSFFALDTNQVVIEATKKAEDSDATVVRLYESWGGRCRAKLTIPAGYVHAYDCDLLERTRAEIEIRDSTLDLDFTPFKIRTVLLSAH